MTTAGEQDGRAVSVRMMLFIAGDEANSRRARENLARFCNGELQGRHELIVVDVFEDFETAVAHNVMVTPTLIVIEPAPPVTILGDLRDGERLRSALRLDPGR